MKKTLPAALNCAASKNQFPLNLLAYCAVMTLVVALPARAATIVYSEHFDNAGFLGSVLDLSQDPFGNISERWGADTSYNNINNFNGWTFSGTSYLARRPSDGNQAVLLNEPTGVATTVVGLAPNAFYSLTFN